MSETAITITIFALYIIVMLAVGLVAYLRTKSLDDYLLGGRHMNYFVTALSAGASDMSGWLILGLPGAVFAAGLTEVWIGVALLLGVYLNWQFIAAPLRVKSEELGAITISEYFERRFEDKTRALRLLTAIVILVFFFIYTISGLVAGGKLFNSVFGINYATAVIIAGLTIVIYTSVGGFIAVSWTDVIQGILMLIALLAVPVIAFTQSPNALENLSSAGALSFTKSISGKGLTTIGMISTFGWGLGYFGMPHILTRFMAIDSVKNIPKARLTAMVWTAISLLMALVVGLAGIAYFNVDGAVDHEKVFINLIQALLHPVPASLFLAAILAAIMSTADSQLLVCTSVVTEDLYRTFLRRDATEKELVTVGRLAVVIIAGGAILFALNPDSKVMDLVSYAWAGFGAAFGPAMILSLYWKKMTGAAAIAGMFIGGAVVVVWKPLSGGIFDIYEIVPGFFLSLLAIWIVTKLTSKE